MARIRILYYVPQLGIGGTEKQLLLLVSRLDPQFEPLVWCPGPRGPVADWLEEAGIPVHLSELNPVDRASMQQAVGWIRSLGAQVFHSFATGWEWFDVIFARLAGIPVCFHSRRNMRHWDPEGDVHPLLHLRNVGSDLVLANCHAVAEWVGRVDTVPPEKIRVLHNGVEMPDSLEPGELRRSLGLAGGELLVGNVANIRPVKGQDVLLRAFVQVLRRIPQARLLICGDGPGRAELENLRDELGMREQVIFLGSRVDTAEVYRSLDLYVHSSLSEGFSNAVLEAMAHGLAVVATTVGGTAEAVCDGETGILTPPGDAESLASALTRSLVEAPLRLRMGVAGRQRVQACFSVGAMVQAHEEIYWEHVERLLTAR